MLLITIISAVVLTPQHGAADYGTEKITGRFTVALAFLFALVSYFLSGVSSFVYFNFKPAAVAAGAKARRKYVSEVFENFTITATILSLRQQPWCSFDPFSTTTGQPPPEKPSLPKGIPGHRNHPQFQLRQPACGFLSTAENFNNKWFDEAFDATTIKAIKAPASPPSWITT